MVRESVVSSIMEHGSLPVSSVSTGMNFDHLKTMLPSQAKKALTEYFLQRLLEAKLDHYANPSYNFSTALGELQEYESWVASIMKECFDTASDEYDRKHPKNWNNETQEAFRVGLS